MTLKEWSNCPNCKLPAIYSDFKRLLEADPTCPMCETNVPAISITLCSDPDSEFKTLTALMKESGPPEEEGAGGDDEDADDME